DELELSRDVGVEADEAKTPLNDGAALVAGGVEDILAAAAQNAMKPRRGNEVVVWVLTAEAQNAKQPLEQAAGAFRKIGVTGIGATDVCAVGTRGGVRIDVKREPIVLDVLRIRTHARNRIIIERHQRVAGPEGAFRRPVGCGSSILGNYRDLQRHAPDRRRGKPVWILA